MYCNMIRKGGSCPIIEIVPLHNKKSILRPQDVAIKHKSGYLYLYIYIFIILFCAANILPFFLVFVFVVVVVVVVVDCRCYG